MSLGILGEYTKIVFASFPETHRFSLRILGIPLDICTFCIFEGDFVYRNNPNLPYSPYMFKYFPHILQYA